MKVKMKDAMKITKAAVEAERNRMLENQELQDRLRWVNDRMYEMEKTIYELSDRIVKLERKLSPADNEAKVNPMDLFNPVDPVKCE